MPISGMLITLVSGHAHADAAVQAISNDKHIRLGVRDGRKLAAVIDSANADEDRRLRTWLDDLPGVEYTDVVFIGFDGDESAADDMPHHRMKQEIP